MYLLEELVILLEVKISRGILALEYKLKHIKGHNTSAIVYQEQGCR
jgi:hypothetical protein